MVETKSETAQQIGVGAALSRCIAARRFAAEKEKSGSPYSGTGGR